MKRAIIAIGATSGIGQEVAKNLFERSWQIGIAGRRQPALEDFQRIAPEQIKIQSLDVTQADAAEKLNTLIRKLGGMDLFLLSSGIGFQNPELDIDIEPEHHTYQRRRIYPHGGHCLRLLLFNMAADTFANYQFYAGTKGLGSAPPLLRHETFPEYLYRCSRTTLPPAKTKYPLHRYPSGFCCPPPYWVTVNTTRC